MMTPEMEVQAAQPQAPNVGDVVALGGDWGRLGEVVEVYDNGYIDVMRGDELIVGHVSDYKKVFDKSQVEPDPDWFRRVLSGA